MPEEVVIFEKTFERFITESVIMERVKNLAGQISEDIKDAEPVFIPILNGSFYFAADLLKHIDFPYEVSFVKMSSYTGLGAGETINTVIGLDKSLKNRNIVLIEDIIDSGRTINNLQNQLKDIAVSDIKIASLIFKPGAVKYPINPDYVGFEAEDGFLIGYGLDFDGKGRHYKDIYKLKE